MIVELNTLIKIPPLIKNPSFWLVQAVQIIWQTPRLSLGTSWADKPIAKANLLRLKIQLTRGQPHLLKGINMDSDQPIPKTIML